MKKVKKGNQLWTPSVSGGDDMIYGKEVNKKKKDKYNKENLNESIKV